MIHDDLKPKIIEKYTKYLQEDPEEFLDCLKIKFKNDVLLEIKYFSSKEYILIWNLDKSYFRIDTAPLYPKLDTFPNHFYDEKNNILADKITIYNDIPWNNIERLIDFILNEYK